MEDFIKTYEVNGYAQFDKVHQQMKIMGEVIPYEDIDCYVFEEAIEVGTAVDIAKEIYSYVFAAVLPLTTLLDENSTRKGVYVCTALQATIWLKQRPYAMHVNFLPQAKSYRIDQEPYLTHRQSFVDLQKALAKVMEKVYGENAEQIVKERLRVRQANAD